VKQLGVILKKEKEKIFQNKHLWVFSGAIASFPDSFENGHLYPIYSHNHQLLGHGYFHQGKSLCGRVVSFGSEDPKKAIVSHLDQAIALRKQLFHPQVTNAFRVVNGEGDRLPGLILDQYDEALVIQSGTLGMDVLLKELILENLVKRKLWKGIYEKSTGSSRKEEKLPEAVRVLFGEDKEEFTILEHGLSFHINWKRGQKTGFFLDQREMRKSIQTLSHKKRVLNCFCYSGGFSVYALAGGASSVHSLDVSSQALSWAEKNIEMNGFSKELNPCLEVDVFKFLSEETLPYDLVILDPPAFAKKKQDIPQASKGYREINRQVLSKLPKDSLLLTCSCSYYIDEAMFQTLLFQAAKMANREIQILGKHLLGMDHPINLFHPESSYLKSFLLRVI
jgi:23S rRNA (cytosine1962-C5)-methyltransferase